jgi:hypothetical protein
VHSYGEAAYTRCNIVSGKRALAALIQSALRGKSKRMSRDYRPLL